MIVCHCNILSDKDILAAVDRLLAENPLRVITPGLVYRELGVRGRCCGCFPLAVDLIYKHVNECLARDQLAHRRIAVMERDAWRITVKEADTALPLSA